MSVSECQIREIKARAGIVLNMSNMYCQSLDAGNSRAGLSSLSPGSCSLKTPGSCSSESPESPWSYCLYNIYFLYNIIIIYCQV